MILFAASAQLPLAQETKPKSEQAPADSPIESNPKAWKEFSSQEGFFSVLLPGTPAQQSQKINTTAGPLDYFTYALQTGLASYFIAYVDFPEVPDDASGVKKILDGGRDGALAIANGKLIAEAEISLKGIPGRALTIEGANALIKARVYLAGLRLYILMMVTNKEQAASPESVKLYEATVSRFLDSFKLTARKN